LRQNGIDQMKRKNAGQIGNWGVKNQAQWQAEAI
jgi:hypothetical protein